MASPAFCAIPLSSVWRSTCSITYTGEETGWNARLPFTFRWAALCSPSLDMLASPGANLAARRVPRQRRRNSASTAGYRSADEGNTLAEEDDANDGKNVAREKAEAQPAWKNARPYGHDAKEQRADDRQRPDDKQEGRRRERGHQPADTALQDREDQDIKPDDDQPDKSNPPYLCRLSYIQCRKTQQQENATQEVDERSSDRRDGQVEVCHGHK